MIPATSSTTRPATPSDSSSTIAALQKQLAALEKQLTAAQQTGGISQSAQTQVQSLSQQVAAIEAQIAQLEQQSASSQTQPQAAPVDKPKHDQATKEARDERARVAARDAGSLVGTNVDTKV